jgi:hypothetical protein
MPDLAPPPSRITFLDKLGRNDRTWIKWLYDLWIEASRGMVPIVPDSLDAVTLVGLLTGTVADVQVMNDGNVLVLDEVSGVPGMTLDFEFVRVTCIRGIVFKGYYVGGAAHWVEIQLYNYTTSAFDIFMTISSGLGMNYRYIEIPDGSLYISGGNAIMRAYHPSSGIPSHDLFIDYVALF